MSGEQPKYPPAGLERDRLIAEKLGWTHIEERNVWRDDGEGAYYVTVLEGCAPGTSFGGSTVPQWSTDLNALWGLYADLTGNWFAQIANLSGGGVMPRINAASITRLQPEVQARTIHGAEDEPPASVGSEAWLEWFDAFGSQG